MLDWLRKELIDECSYSNINNDRTTIKHVRINGRLYDKYGVDCATTAYTLVYKVPVPGVKQFKYAILVGIARQNPNDIVITKKEGIEIAKANALTNPVMTIIYDSEPYYNALIYIMKSYILGLPVQFVKTKDEILLEGKNPQEYSRIINQDEYYKYYKDLKKYLINKYEGG